MATSKSWGDGAPRNVGAANSLAAVVECINNAQNQIDDLSKQRKDLQDDKKEQDKQSAQHRDAAETAIAANQPETASSEDTAKAQNDNKSKQDQSKLTNDVEPKLAKEIAQREACSNAAPQEAAAQKGASDGKGGGGVPFIPPPPQQSQSPSPSPSPSASPSSSPSPSTSPSPVASATPNADNQKLTDQILSEEQKLAAQREADSKNTPTVDAKPTPGPAPKPPAALADTNSIFKGDVKLTSNDGGAQSGSGDKTPGGLGDSFSGGSSPSNNKGTFNGPDFQPAGTVQKVAQQPSSQGSHVVAANVTDTGSGGPNNGPAGGAGGGAPGLTSVGPQSRLIASAGAASGNAVPNIANGTGSGSANLTAVKINRVVTVNNDLVYPPNTRGKVTSTLRGVMSQTSALIGGSTSANRARILLLPGLPTIASTPGQGTPHRINLSPILSSHSLR